MLKKHEKGKEREWGRVVSVMVTMNKMLKEKGGTNEILLSMKNYIKCLHLLINVVGSYGVGGGGGESRSFKNYCI